MIAPPLPPSSYTTELSWASYNPGYLNQDLVTIPIEASTLALMNLYYTPRGSSLWPFTGESNTETPHKTTYTASKLAPYVLGVTSAVLGGLSLSNDNFSTGVFVRGWIHDVLVTEIVNSSAKLDFQRERPFYDTELQNNANPADDDRFSFVSGHSSHAFAYATYSSLMMIYYSNSPWIAWAYTAFVYMAAVNVAYSRVSPDHAHHLSDTIAGAIIGTTVSALMFYRVKTVSEQIKKQKNTETHLNWMLSPTGGITDDGKNWYGANFKAEF